MRLLLCLSTLLLLPACQQTSSSTYEQQLAANHGYWQNHGAQISSDHHGKWILIADGTLHGQWLDFNSAWKTAHALPAEQSHAYLYRAGIDDVEIKFNLSPFMNNNPRWVQLGVPIRRPWKLTIAAVADTWYRGDKKVSWGDAGARVELTAAPDGKQKPHVVRAVASNLFHHDLTLRESDVQALGLGRFTAPAAAIYGHGEQPCRKVVLQIAIPELGIQAPAVAFVLPKAETDKALLQPPLPSKYGFQTLD